MSFLLKHHATEVMQFQRRIWVAAGCMLLLLGFLIGRLLFLQVIEHERFTTLSRNNHVQTIALPARRGLIYDRNGVLLAKNKPAYRVELVPEQLNEKVDIVLTRLSEYIPLTPEDLSSINVHLKRSRAFERIPVKLNINEEQMNTFMVHQYEFPGVTVSANLVREYPDGVSFAHTVGYVGRISEHDFERVNGRHYEGTDFIGKTGIEYTYEDMLHGQVGYQQVEADALGRTVRDIDRFPAVPGWDITLTLDSQLQIVAQQALGNNRGAIVALIPHTGEVLAMVSNPSFNANYFVNGIDEKTYQALRLDPNQPLFDRALKGQYPPASTLKPFIGIAGLEEQVISAKEQIYDPGWFKLEEDSRLYKDWRRTGHGLMNLSDAISESCDTYFYTLADRLGIDAISHWLTLFGFGQRTNIDLPGEQSGLVPSAEWKQRQKGEPWYRGETLITGIGQGFLLSTPLQLAHATATLANKGIRPQVHLLKNRTDDKGHQIHFSPKTLGQFHLSQEHYWETVRQGMENAIESPKGTARRLKAGLTYSMAGKTGTAQVFGLKEGESYDKHAIEEHLRDHTLFIALAPSKQPQVAIAVILENNAGSSLVGKAFLDGYFSLYPAN